MKKLILSLSVVISFLLYSLTTKKENPTVTPLPTPSTDTLTVTPTSTVTERFNTIPSSSPPPTPTPKPNGQFKDGTFNGSVADAYYGNIQVEVTISNGALTDVKFLQYPSDRDRSIRINEYAMPILRQEAMSAQSARVDIVSGATDSSQAFIESLSQALAQAK